MKAFRVGGFIRIHKKSAERRYDKGEVIYLCPEKLRPGPPWSPECAIAKDDYSRDSQYFVAYTKDFNDVVNEYTHYNCFYKVGKYPAFYIREEVK